MRWKGVLLAVLLVSSFAFNSGQAEGEDTIMGLTKRKADIKKEQVEAIFEGDIYIKNFASKLSHQIWSATLDTAQYAPHSSVYYVLQQRLETIEDSQVNIGAMLLKELDEIRVSNQKIVNLLEEILKELKK